MGRGAVDVARNFADNELFADVVSSTPSPSGVVDQGAVERRLALAEEVLTRPISREQELYLRLGAAAAHLQAGDSAAAIQQMTRCVELTRRIRAQRGRRTDRVVAALSSDRPR